MRETDHIDVTVTGCTAVVGAKVLSTPVPDATSASGLAVSTFERDANGCLGFYGHTFRAAIRECLTEMGFFREHLKLHERNEDGLAMWTLAQDLDVLPEFVRLERDESPITKPDQVVKQPVMRNDKGQISYYINQFETVDLPWQARVVLGCRGVITCEALEKALTLMSVIGWGRLRAMGYGKLTAKVLPRS